MFIVFAAQDCVNVKADVLTKDDTKVLHFQYHIQETMFIIVECL